MAKFQLPGHNIVAGVKLPTAAVAGLDLGPRGHGIANLTQFSDTDTPLVSNACLAEAHLWLAGRGDLVCLSACPPRPRPRHAPRPAPPRRGTCAGSGESQQPSSLEQENSQLFIT